jgi:hypothetical protein
MNLPACVLGGCSLRCIKRQEIIKLEFWSLLSGRYKIVKKIILVSYFTNVAKSISFLELTNR